MVVSSTSMKVASITEAVISQGFSRGCHEEGAWPLSAAWAGALIAP